MGISRGGARLLLNECASRPFSGSVLQLGRQKCFFTSQELERWASLHGVSLATNTPDSNSRADCNAKSNCIDDVTFFKAFGFDVVESCDYSDFQGADHVLNLNLPVPEYLHNKYDVIYDGGTLEHVFHVPQVLENIFNMLKIGGRVIHNSPSSNHVDHGFYMFSPTLFHDYYGANNWQIETSRIIEYTYRHNLDPWKIYEYTPGALDHLSFGGFDKGYLLGIYFVASKTKASTAKNIPQQGRYQQKWQSGESQMDGNEHSVGEASSQIMQKLIVFLKRYPKIFKLVRMVHRGIFRKNSMPPLIAKY